MLRQPTSCCETRALPYIKAAWVKSQRSKFNQGTNPAAFTSADSCLNAFPYIHRNLLELHLLLRQRTSSVFLQPKKTINLGIYATPECSIAT